MQEMRDRAPDVLDFIATVATPISIRVLESSHVQMRL